MSYAEKNLSKGDSIIMKAQVCWLAILSKIIVNAVLLILAVMSKRWLYEIGDVLTVAVIIIAIISIIATVLTIANTELALSNKKLIGKVGIINTKSMDSPLNKINNVSVDQGLFGKIFNYTKITVSTSSGNFVFNYVVAGDTLKNKIMEQIDIYENERIRDQAALMAQSINKQ